MEPIHCGLEKFWTYEVIKMKTWVVVDGQTSKIVCITQEIDGEIAIATAANNEGDFALDLGDINPNELHNKKYIDGNVVDDVEQMRAIAEDQVRFERDNRLRNEVDPIVTNPLRWADMTTEQQNAWSQYRTDLLNIPQQSGFPDNIDWPTKP